MIKINTTDFRDYSSKAVYEFLFLQGETEFEITIPREFATDEHENYCIFTDYINASYSGQCLALIADTFAYFVPSEFTKKPFQFEIKVTDMEKFADTLHFIIQGNNFRDTREPFLTFQNLAFQFLIDAFEDKVECHTWGLLHIANLYLDE